jgi:hypothetical protein
MQRNDCVDLSGRSHEIDMPSKEKVTMVTRFKTSLVCAGLFLACVLVLAEAGKDYYKILGVSRSASEQVGKPCD